MNLWVETIQNSHRSTAINETVHHERTDKTCSACHEYFLHGPTTDGGRGASSDREAPHGAYCVERRESKLVGHAPISPEKCSRSSEKLRSAEWRTCRRPRLLPLKRWVARGPAAVGDTFNAASGELGPTAAGRSHLSIDRATGGERVAPWAPRVRADASRDAPD